MIYLHETRHVIKSSGYGGAFQHLYRECLKLEPGRMFTLPADMMPRGDDWKPKMPDIEIEIFFGQPYGHYSDLFSERYCEKRGVFTMWEWPRINPDMVRTIEKYFDFIIVPTEWCRQVFTSHFPDHKVYVSPLGVDPELYPFLSRSTRDREFTFIWQGFCLAEDRTQDRKRRDLVQRAFQELKLPNSRLIMKAHSGAAKFKTRLLLPCPDGLTWISDDFSHSEQLSLWQQCDFGLNPSEGEGVGLIPLEMMSTGMPVALADNTGASTYCNPEVNYPLKCTEELPPANFDDGTTCMVPSLDEVKDVMQHAYYERDAIREKGRKAATWIRENHTYGHAASRLMELIRIILSGANENREVEAA